MPVGGVLCLGRALLLSLLLASLLVTPARSAGLKLPFHTSGRDIVASDGSKVLYAGTNWVGTLEAVIPEGLQYSSIAGIVAKIKGFGLNAVRLTYPTQLVDDIYTNGTDTPISLSLVNALGRTNGTRVFNQILQHNPQFNASTKRLEVFDAVARELAKQNVIVHLDNHISQAKWCCFPGDGNGWFNESQFNVTNWVRGWAYMAKHAAANWPSFASVGLRNELRFPLLSKTAEPYDWYTWSQEMTAAASAIHSVAPNALIFFGGYNSDGDNSPLPRNTTLNGTAGRDNALKTTHFDPSKQAYRDKVVLEIHKYDDFVKPYTGDCPSFESTFYAKGGFQALNSSDPTTVFTLPIVMTEWGFSQDSTTYMNKYPQCLLDFVQKHKFGWMQWQVGGSYYIRQGTQDRDEGWGLLNHNWNGTRSQVSVDNFLSKMVQALK